MVKFSVASATDTLPSPTDLGSAGGHVYLVRGCGVPHSLFTHWDSECGNAASILGYTAPSARIAMAWSAVDFEGTFLEDFATRQAAGEYLERYAKAAWSAGVTR